MILSACGLICDECEFFNKSCTGCIDVKGFTFSEEEHQKSIGVRVAGLRAN